MGKTGKIIRRSIASFLKNYQYFTSTPCLLALPFAISTLLSQSLVSKSPIFPLLHGRITSLFLASGIPHSSQLFSILNLKLSQTILSFIFISPFTLSSLLLAKASIIEPLLGHNIDSSRPSWISLFNPLLITQLCNSLVILSANSTCFFLIAIFFNFFGFLGLLSSRGALMLISAMGVLTYSIILANVYVICNLALVSSGIETNGGFISILKACFVIKGRILTALSLALPMNMALAAIEALFQYRIIRSYHQSTVIDCAMVFEGLFIAYLYCILVVLDTIVGCMFWRSCKRNYCEKMEIQERDGKSYSKLYDQFYLQLISQKGIGRFEMFTPEQHV